MSKIDLIEYPTTVHDFHGDEQRAKVFLDRYSLRGTDGKPIEMSYLDTAERVASAIGKDGDQTEEFAALLQDMRFVPGGRVLSGAGTGTDVTFYNCYVIPIETKARRENRNGPEVAAKGTDVVLLAKDKGSDSREAIIDTVGTMVDIMSRGGGVGINWSTLRPRNAYLKSINATSSGPIDWMHFASVAVGTVEQGGSRRGAAMFMLNDWHPDIEEFINAKRTAGRITNANISVGVSAGLMDAVRSDGDWELVFPDTTDRDYDSSWDGGLAKWKASGGGVRVHRTVRARDLWRSITDAAHASGEPGIVFLDRYNEQSTAGLVETIICVNPCGEQGLGAYSVCNLGSMNLAAYIGKAGAGYSPTGKSFDYDAFSADVQTAVQFMDRVIDVNRYFIPENERAQKNLRRIGLGVMGLADALVLLGIRYGSPDAVKFTERVFSEMKNAAIFASVRLAEQYGPAPAWDKSMLERPYLKSLPGIYRDDIEKHGLRNLFLLTQAPTGTTSILAGVNSGIEPLFAFGYWREDRTGKHWVEPSCIKGLLDGETTTYPTYVVTANDVTVEEHIAMQAAVQKYVDSSVSKTINAPNSQTADETAKAYQLAYDSGLKGLAYYRDGSRDVQVLNNVKEEAKGETEFARDDILMGSTRKVASKVGSVYVTVNRDSTGTPVEVFFLAGKSGEETMLMAEAMGRLASLALRKGATLGGVANQLEGIGGQTNIAWSTSLPHAIGKALSAANADRANVEAMVDEMMAEEYGEDPKFAPYMPPCPDCGQGTVIVTEGCRKCVLCGWSAC